MGYHFSSHSENYLVRWGSRGFPKEVEMLNNLKVVFTVGVHCLLITTLHTPRGMILEMRLVDWSGGGVASVQSPVLCFLQGFRAATEGFVCSAEAVGEMDLLLSLSSSFSIFFSLTRTHRTHAEHYVNKYKPPPAIVSRCTGYHSYADFLGNSWLTWVLFFGSVLKSFLNYIRKKGLPRTLAAFVNWIFWT